MSKTLIMFIKFICSLAPIYFVTFITPKPLPPEKSVDVMMDQRVGVLTTDDLDIENGISENDDHDVIVLG